MAIQSWHEKFLLFVLSYVSLVCLPIFGIVKILTVLVECFEDAIRPKNSPECHTEKVKHVQKQVLEWNASGRKTKMCTARPGWKTLSIRTPRYKDTMTGIKVDLDDIVDIDPIKKVVRIEPLMTMGRLTSILLPMGWTLPVVPELNDLTVGGLLCGAGIETSSHKYGLFHKICISMEVVLASGEVVICSKDQHSDLFYAMPGSCGTLGFLTSAEFHIIPAKKYVKLEYIPVHSLDEAISTFEAQTYRKDGNEFVEGIMYSLDKGVIMVGNMVDEAESGLVNSIGRWYKPWFYKHVETFLTKNSAENLVEYIPLRDYYHRHTRCLFWELVCIFPYGNNIFFRYFLGWILPIKHSYLKLAFPKWAIKLVDRIHALQDFVVPMDKLKECLILTHKEIQVYPIWLCPAKFMNTPGMCRIQGEYEMYVDFGVYGYAKQEEYELVRSARIVEQFCIQNRGYQALYADICSTREEFDKMYDNTHYLKVREELKCTDAFPDIYDKVCRAARR